MQWSGLKTAKTFQKVQSTPAQPLTPLICQPGAKERHGVLGVLEKHLLCCGCYVELMAQKGCTEKSLQLAIIKLLESSSQTSYYDSGQKISPRFSHFREEEAVCHSQVACNTHQPKPKQPLSTYFTSAALLISLKNSGETPATLTLSKDFDFLHLPKVWTSCWGFPWFLKT